MIERQSKTSMIGGMVNWVKKLSRILDKKWIIEKLVYQNDSDLINSPRRKSQDFFILQAIAGSATMCLISGVVLSGYAIYLGASDEVVSYVPLISSISGIFIVFSMPILEKFRNLKKLVFTMNLICKPLIVLIVFIPLLVPEKLRIPVLLIIIFTGFFLNLVMNLAINSWFVNVIPLKIRGRYIAIRQIFAVIVSAVVPLISGIVLDLTGKSYKGFAILFGSALVFILLENYAFWNIEDSYNENAGTQKLNIIDVFLIPLRNSEFMKFTCKMIVFYLLLYISASFSQVYMIRYLYVSYTLISVMTALNAVIQVIVLPWWGRICDLRGNKSALNLSIWLFVGDIFMWFMVSRGSKFVFIPMAYIIGAFSNSSFAVASFDRKFSVIPEKCRMLYDGFYTAAIGLVLLVAPYIGGKIKTFLAASDFIKNSLEFGEFRILYAITVIGLILLQLHDVLKERKEKRKTSSSEDVVTGIACADREINT